MLAMPLGQALASPNWGGTKSLAADVCPHVRLSDMVFMNEPGWTFYASWTNVGQKPVVAFEMVILMLDPFNRQLPTVRWIVPGQSMANWDALQPGQTSKDSRRERVMLKTFATIAYVERVRFADGSVWQAPADAVKAALKAEGSALGAPDIQP